MKKYQIYMFVLLITLMATFTGCGKDVYVVGKDDAYGVTLWKNGEVQVLSEGNFNAWANSVFVSGANVYVAGNERGRALGPALWKNGVPQSLADEGSAYRVFVSNGDVYVAGYENVEDESITGIYTRRNVATLWKNGTPQRLSDDISGANSVFVSGKDVYVVGGERDTATLWKNGKAETLRHLDGASGAISVFVSGRDVYVAGYGMNDVVTLWKNSEPQLLAISGFATSVFVSGDDVYAAGFERVTVQGNEGDETTDFAVLWKNGKRIRLSDVRSCANGVFVSGSDVYVAGCEINAQGYDEAVLWKNGRPQRLSNGSFNAYAMSVFVK